MTLHEHSFPIHVMPGLLNSHNGVSPHEQANHVALFLDRCLSRDTME